MNWKNLFSYRGKTPPHTDLVLAVVALCGFVVFWSLISITGLVSDRFLPPPWRVVEALWTMLFLHKPLWTYSERNRTAGNPDPTNWQRVEALLGDRPHSVFAGHVHHYVQYDRNGMKYYHLATTGGGSRLRGQSYGEFD